MPSLLLLLFLPLLLLVPPAASVLEFRYHSNQEIEEYLMLMNTSNSDITYLYSIGQSVKGQELWVLALGVNPHNHTVGIPEFKYVGNMHGNEVLGRLLLLKLIDDLVENFRKNETWAVRLLSSTRIHIMPTMNPDGFDVADTDCILSQGRYNSHGVDLNRNFPDAFDGLRKPKQLDEEKRQAEVQAVMAWLRKVPFVLSANLHGGALVASYPYDNGNSGSQLINGASISPDDDVFIHLSKVYSYNHANMHQGDRCSDGRTFSEGITNGYQWYPLVGGMQDYNYIWAQCLEVTLEVSCCKFPPPSQLPALWTENRKALLAFIQQVHLGVKGQVLNGSGYPVENAEVEVDGRNNLCPFRTDRYGEYYRLLLPGTYTFTVRYPGHEVLTETLTIPHGPDQYSAMTHNFRLRQTGTTSGQTSASPTQTTTCNKTLNLEGGGATNRPTWPGISLILGLLVTLQSLIH